MTLHLFTYGTLELAEVYQAITGQHKAGMPAVLPDYARYILRDAAYPGIINRSGEQTKGTLYLNVDPVAMRKIEHYEDTCYIKQQVMVQTEDQQQYEAWAFVIPADKPQLLSDKNWDQQHFVKHHLPTFLRYIG